MTNLLHRKALLVFLLGLVVHASAGGHTAQQPGAPSTSPGRDGLSVPRDDPFPSTYERIPSPPLVIRDATIMTAAGPSIRRGTIVVRDGKIVVVGETADVPPGATVIDGTGK
jgi:hypothetical protein